MEGKEVLLVYDKECPVCEGYCRLIRINESVGKLRRVDAREPSAIMEEIRAAGLDIDQGMVLKRDGAIYYGAEAIRALALISSPSGLFNRLNSWAFRSKTRSRSLYPVLRFFRNLLLKCLGKTKVNNLGLKNNFRF